MNRRSWIGGAGDDDADDAGVGELTKEILSRVDENSDEYLTDADEFVMSPLANVSNRMEMTRAGNLDENVRVRMMTLVPLGTRQKEMLCTVGRSQGIRALREEAK